MFSHHHRTENPRNDMGYTLCTYSRYGQWRDGICVTLHADLCALSPSLSVRKVPSLHDFTLMLA